MPPLSGQFHESLRRKTTAALLTSTESGTRWSQPSDVFSVLLILGGDVVHKALAQSVGTSMTPVIFSFGWVSFAISALYSCVSNTSLMPPGSECPTLVFTVKNGYVRANNSWVLSRLLRDIEYWMDKAVHDKLTQMMSYRHDYMKAHARRGTEIPLPKKTGLCISIYEPCKVKKAGVPVRDLGYWSGFVVAIAQLSIAAVPIITDRDWSVVVITSIGTVLALLTGALPQWRREKWYARRDAKNAYILTRGNGAQHALMILGNDHGLNLEDLAVGVENLDAAATDWTTRTVLFILGCLWVALLIGAAGLSQPSWYLLSVGGIGMLQNLMVAGWRRKPGAMGIHLNFCKVIGHMSTMDALLELEMEYPNAGRSLLRTFFPGPLLLDEERKWAALATRHNGIPSTLRQPDKLESWAQQARSFEK